MATIMTIHMSARPVISPASHGAADGIAMPACIRIVAAMRAIVSQASAASVMSPAATMRRSLRTAVSEAELN